MSAFFRKFISLPSNFTDPDLGLNKPTKTHAIIDLPDPVSPAKPKVSPSRTAKETSLTTFIIPDPLSNNNRFPPLTTKETVRLFTSTMLFIASLATSTRHGAHHLSQKQVVQFPYISA